MYTEGGKHGKFVFYWSPKPSSCISNMFSPGYVHLHPKRNSNIFINALKYFVYVTWPIFCRLYSCQVPFILSYTTWVWSSFFAFFVNNPIIKMLVPQVETCKSFRMLQQCYWSFMGTNCLHYAAFFFLKRMVFLCLYFIFTYPAPEWTPEVLI